MLRQKRTRYNQIVVFAMLLLGIGIVVISAYYVSSFLAILGVSIIFWGFTLLYVTPVKQVPLELLNATSEAATANIERLISQANLSEKGIYLPTKTLNSSLVFIPEFLNAPLPAQEEMKEKQFTNKKIGGLFVTPPGSALAHLFEKELGFSVTKTEFNQIGIKLSKLLVKELDLMEDLELKIQNKTLNLEITASIFDDVCWQADSFPKTHWQVGRLLSSAIACILAKSSGKPLIIKSETHNQETKTTNIEYQLLEG